ncbi:MAG: 3-hydroxyacyl-CoA dehydrogenase/enoyl-CoA hydratase family protein [Bacteroidales bacterium]
MIRRIRKVAVLGSGVMGSGIACHLANVGLEVLLLDISPSQLNDIELSKGLKLDQKSVKNRIVNDYLQAALKSKPSPIYKQNFAKRITTGNFDDDLPLIKEADWIIEVVVERLDIKKQIFEKIEKYRTKGTLVSSNTSGISVEAMIEGRSEDFCNHFCGTHFFNPPRYLQLFEIIPTSKTDPSVLTFFENFAAKFLGKSPVVAKDTPAFIANRVGTFAIMELFHNVQKFGLNIPEIDKLTGTIIGRAKSATFRTADLVGLDTLVHVATNIKNSTKDESSEIFELPGYIDEMLKNKWLGSKSGQGFYKKTEEGGVKKILSLDFNSMTYIDTPKPFFPVFEKTKGVDDLRKRTKILCDDQGKAGEFYRSMFYSLFWYVSNRIPEISDELYKIDLALNSGFGWKLGPFQTWDALGVKEVIENMEKAGKKPAQWIYEMVQKGITTFYTLKEGRKFCYHPGIKDYALIPGQDDILSLEILRKTNTVWENNDATIVNLGDGILNLEFHSKMNTIGQGTLQAINKAIDLAESDYQGLVISNDGEHFSAGANVGMIFMFAVEQEWDELNWAINWFQKTMMRIRYSAVPVVAAPHGLTLGGGCELCMHADKVIAHAETYMGLVEFGVGVIPGGGGTKEFVLRLSDELKEGDVRTNAIINRFMTIGQAKVSTSAHEAFDLGYLRKGTDEVVVSRMHQLAYAKNVAVLLAEKGYTKPVQRTDIKVLGNEALGLVYVGSDTMVTGNYMSEHDKLIAEKLGFVLAGGNISNPLTEVSEQYLLDLERKAFLELCMQKKTLERMQSLITSGKILRN